VEVDGVPAELPEEEEVTEARNYEFNKAEGRSQ